MASLARDIPDATADDEHIRQRIITEIEKHLWCPIGLSVTVRNGIAHLSGVITDERSRQAVIVPPRTFRDRQGSRPSALDGC